MLDAELHQAAGLHSFAPHTSLRVLGVASQEKTGAGLETLWQMCAIFQRLGYPVVVLDGTARETAGSPGLIDLLQQTPWSGGTRLSAGMASGSVAVIPAFHGLRQLALQTPGDHATPLQTLVPWFKSYGLLVVHAPAAALGPLLVNTATTPLVMMGSGASGVVNAYKSLKQIALHAGLPSMVAALLRTSQSSERQSAQSALASLQDCAERHLGGMVRTTTIAARSPQDVQRLALQLLENAGTIPNTLTVLPPSSSLTDMPAHFVRSH